MRTIGIISTCLGGSINFYTQLVQFSLTTYQNRTPEILFHQMPLEEYFSAFRDLNITKISELLDTSMRKLSNAGASLIVIPNNTSHAVIENIINSSSISILNMIEITANFCHSQQYQRVVLLGTNTLIKSGIYQKYLNNFDIKSILLSEADAQLLNNEILQATTSGDLDFKFSTSIKNKIIDCANKNSCNAIILACSDLVRAFHSKLEIPTINPLELLAKVAVNIAMK